MFVHLTMYYKQLLGNCLFYLVVKVRLNYCRIKSHIGTYPVPRSVLSRTAATSD